MKARKRKPVLWVVEFNDLGHGWAPAETVSLSLAVYASRADARRAIHNGETGELVPRWRRLRAYVRRGR